MADIEKEIKKEEKKLGKFFKKKENIWMSVSILLAVVVIIMFIVSLTSGISKASAGSKMISYLTTLIPAGDVVTLKNVTSLGNVYEITVDYKGQSIPVYMTRDGKYMINGLQEINPSPSVNTNTNTQTPAEVPKSDKPSVDLWVFTYCPYGTQTEKGLIPVYNLLKSKTTINIKFIGAMHGEFEKTESLRQLCIQKNYGQDKFMSYIMKLDTNASVGNCGGQDSCVNPIITNIFKSLSIDSTKINTCMKNDAPALYAAQEKEAQSLGISGSPTLVVNGVQTQSGRSSAALLTTICSAFNTKPSECSQTLDSSTPSAGFGATASESASAAKCG